MRFDLEKEKTERLEAQKSLQERITALEHTNSLPKPPISSGVQGREYKNDPCMCVVGGCGVLAREEAM